MHRIAKRIKTRQNIGRDIGVAVPYISYRNRQVFGKRTVPIYTDTARLHAQMSTPGKTISAVATDKVPFATHYVTWADILNVATNLFYETNKFIANNQRNWNGFLCSLIPVVDMKVCSTDGGLVNPYQHVVDTNFRNRRFVKPQTKFGIFLNILTNAFIFLISLDLHRLYR